MKKNAFYGFLIVFLMLALAGPLFAPNDGCTPGWWKNHTDLWPDGYDPNSLISNLFPAVATCFPEMANRTLLQVLQIGGPGNVKWPKEIRNEYKAAEQLLMHAVAAVLNWEHHRLHYYGIRYYGYPADPDPDVGLLILDVDLYLCMGSAEAMENFKDDLDDWNNRICPPRDTWMTP